ncbi:MAG: hypothetical protein KBT20_04760 [Bacteroidales bacterium]|nr:hypothetical protein [Candidatus Liminaster caballi]
MKREDAIAKGIEMHDIKHSMKRRLCWHDYNRKGVYMLTLVVEGRAALLGRLLGRSDAPAGSCDAPRVECSELGMAILRDEIGKINHFYPQVVVWKVCIMPDHIHMIVRVKEDLPPKQHLGQVVAGFKGGCSKAAMRILGRSQSGRSGNGNGGPAAGVGFGSGNNGSPAAGVGFGSGNGNGGPAAGVGVTVPPPSGGVKVIPLFEPGYNDKILLNEGQLDRWKAYLDDNPRRLMVKRQNPALFTVLHGLKVAGHECQAVGNRFLLDIPDKMAVVVHRRYSEEYNARLREEWLACGERGGVLVSAAIAPKEKAVMREAMDRGYRIILLRENGFPTLYKPSGESFDACSEGRLLQISPWDYHMAKKAITRNQCLELNDMAECIANNRMATAVFRTSMSTDCQPVSRPNKTQIAGRPGTEQ